jgi:hypothetical protein
MSTAAAVLDKETASDGETTLYGHNEDVDDR